MKNIRLSITSAVLLSALGCTVGYAEPIGRVLVAVGDTTALRNGMPVKLTRGSEVQSGDTLRVGESSNMQVRFNDEGVTALRSNSVFRIDDYKFEEKTNVGKSFFSLLKGGMRSITGLIGKFNRDNYAVKAQTATIGIRGTHFVLAQCSNDCFNKDGSKAENGLFGGVTDGRIAVSNQAGEHEFGKNEFFHVASSDALPKPLLAPPSFLRDQLEGQSKSEKGKTVVAKGAGAGETENGDKAKSGESQESAETATVAEGSETTSASTEQQTNTSVTTQPTVGVSLSPPPPPPLPPTGQPVVQSALLSAYPYKYAWANAWTGNSNKPFRDPTTGMIYAGTNWGFGYSDAGIEQGTLTVLNPTLLQQPDPNKMMFAEVVVNMGTPVTFFANAYTRSGVWNYYNFSGVNNCFNNCVGVLDGTASYTWNKTASVGMGSSVAAGNLSWGRYSMTTSGTILTGTFAGFSYSETSHEHWVTGDPVNFAALPTTGTYSYGWVGGTQPTDQNGAVGTMNNGGTVGMTFNPTGAGVSLTGASWTMPSGSSYSLSFGTVTPVQVTISQTPLNLTNPGWTSTGSITTISQIVVPAACTGGGCTGSVTATISPMLFGANAQGLAAGISTMPALVGGQQVAGERTSSVQVYQVVGTPPM